MEQDFQTSFIPKKPIVPERAVATKPVGSLLVVALLILFTVLIAAGGLYFYKGLTQKKKESMEKNLLVAQARFEPARIAELQVLDKRLRAGAEILANHIAVTPIFEALQALTLKTVRFTNFSFELGEDRSIPIRVAMSGMAVGYRSIALQSDLLAKNKSFLEPIFSNLTLDKSGNVLFDLEFSVDPSFLNYQRTLPAGS